MKKFITTIACQMIASAVLLMNTSCSQQLRVDPKIAKFNLDCDNLINGIQQYKEFTGSYPPGDNLELTKAISGQTDKKILIIAVRKSDLNAKGEILDPCGTPLQFFFAKNGVLIRSAGPNKVFEDTANPHSDDLFRTESTAK